LSEAGTGSGASAEAIQAHYDTGNAFYSLWLDRALTYSCALWDDASSLEEAQLRKLDYHVEEAKAAGAARVLDVGCGWGSMLDRLTATHGVGRAVGLTLSEAQAKYIASLGLSDAEVHVESWADHVAEEPYDAIISIGAFEHFVRPETPSQERIAIYRHFFARCREMLRPGGCLSLQTIAYGGIGRFKAGAFASIFPESDLPRLAELTEAVERQFEVVRLRNDPHDYSRTIQHWLRSFRENREEIVQLVGEPRAMEYERFLASAIKGFDIGVFNLFRVTLRRVDLGD
jgi:cyclopropane-fatty-acyl-phospholipid synthase